MRSAWTLVLFAMGCGAVKDEPPTEDTPFEVLTAAPAPDATDVAVTAPIVIELSTEVDASTVTATSFTIVGAGADVAGERSVDGTTITFTPAGPMFLLGSYDVTLTTAVAGTSGLALVEPYTFNFRIVDGTWRARMDIAADVGAVGYPFARHNRKGEMIVAYGANTATKDIKVVEFDPVAGTFGVPMVIETSNVVYNTPVATINEAGDVIVAWSVPMGGAGAQTVWARRTGGNWSTPVTNSVALGDLAMMDDGTAVMAIDVNNGVNFTTLGPMASAWAATQTLFAPTGQGTAAWGIHQAGPRVEVVAMDRTAGQVRARGITSSGAMPVQNLSPTGIGINWVNFDYMPDNDLVFSWWQNDTDVWYSRFDAATSTWSMGQKVSDGTYGSAVCSNAAGDRVSAFLSAGSMYATFSRAGETTWATPQNLGSPTGLEYTSCYLDPFGNGHLMFAGYGTTKSFYTRFANGAFSQATELEDGPGFMTLVEDPGTGRARAIYYDYTGQKIQVRTFQ